MIDSADIVAFFAAHSGFFTTVSWAIFSTSLIQNIVYMIQLPLGWLELSRYSQADDTETGWQTMTAETTMPISLIVPAYNEEVVIVDSVRAMLAIEYPEMEVIVVNDGSKDRTLEKMIDAFALKPLHRAYAEQVPHKPIRAVYGSPLYPDLIVVDKENGGGKADGSNAGINIARHPLFCIVDADSILEPAALLRAVRPFTEEPDKMIAVGGTIRIANGCTIRNGQIVSVALPRKFLPLVQTLEYIRAFLMARLALSYMGVLTIISGAFGIFRRDLTIACGGFSHDTVGEDYELVLKLHRYMRERNLPYAMRYVPEPVCWTEAPETLAILGNQRKRWQRGALETFAKHKDMLFNPRYGRIGFIGFPLAFIVDVLGPIAEVAGYILMPIFYAVGILNLSALLAWTGLIFAFGVFISTSCLILEEMELKRVPNARDLARLAGIAVIENFGYRQLNNVWRAIGWWEFLRKKKGWGVMTRTGFTPSK